MIGPDTKGHVEIACRQSSHPCRRLKFADKEIDHFLLLLSRHHIADVHKRRPEIVTMMDLVIAAVWQSAFPNSFSGDVKLLNTAAEVRGFASKRIRFPLFALEFQQLSRKTKI